MITSDDAKNYSEQLHPAFAGYLSDGEITERDALSEIFQMIKEGVLAPEFTENDILKGIAAIRLTHKKPQHSFEEKILEKLFQGKQRLTVFEVGYFIKEGIIQKIIKENLQAIVDFPIVKEKLSFSLGRFKSNIFIGGVQIDTVEKANYFKRTLPLTIIITGVVFVMFFFLKQFKLVVDNSLRQYGANIPPGDFRPEGINMFIGLLALVPIALFLLSKKTVNYSFKDNVIPVVKKYYEELYFFLKNSPLKKHFFINQYLPFCIAFGLDDSWHKDFGLESEIRIEQDLYKKNKSAINIFTLNWWRMISIIFFVLYLVMIFLLRKDFFTGLKTTTPIANPSPNVVTYKMYPIVPISPKSIYNLPEPALTGAPVDCQPDYFDPQTSEYTKVKSPGTPSELYKVGDEIYPSMMINGWRKENAEKIYLQTPYDFDFYKFGCASTESSVYEIKKNGQRQALYTHVKNTPPGEAFSDDKKFLYMANYLKSQDSKWRLLKRIIDIEKNQIIELPDLECVSEFGLWSGDKLITYSDLNKTKDIGNLDYDAKVCIWTSDGKLINTLLARFYWEAASRYYLADKIGLLPEDQNIFYAVSSNLEGKKDNICSLYLQDMRSQARNRKIVLVSDSYIRCPNIEFDFSNFKIDSASLRYKVLENADGTANVGDWQEAR